MAKEWVDIEDKMTRLKFGADRAFCIKDYSYAVQLYSQILESGLHLPPQMLRDTMEAKSRCLMHLGEFQESLGIAKQMCDLATNKDYKMCSWMLLAQIYHQNEDYASELGICINLIQHHPLNINYWACFAEAFALHWGIVPTQIHPTTFPECINFNEKIKQSLLVGLNLTLVHHILGSCYIRIKNIYQSCGIHIKGSGLLRYTGLQEKADRWLKSLPLSENFYEITTQMFCKDVFGEKNETEDGEFQDLGKTKCTEMQSEESPSREIFMVEEEQFFTQWFGWLKHHLETSAALQTFAR